MKPQKSWNTDKSAFVSGSADNICLYGHGGTVKLWILGGDIVMLRSATRRLGRSQITMRPNTRDARAELVDCLSKALADSDKHSTRGVENTAPPPPMGAQTRTLTVGRILSAHLQAACPNAPSDALHTWTRRQLREHYEAMPPSLRDAAKSADQVAKILEMSRILLKTEGFRADRPYDELESRDFRYFLHELLEQGHSPDTVITYLSVLSAAIRRFSVHHPSEWNGRHDITQDEWRPWN